MKRVAVCAILFVMPIRSSVAPLSPRQDRSISLADQPQVRAALEWLDKDLNWVTEQQVRLTEIPAPSFQEEKRAEAVKALLAAEGLSLRVDKMGNVIGELRGAREDEVVLLTAHLDTVFPAGTDVQVRREGERLMAPGISDNGTGLAGMLAVVRAIHAAKIKPERTILFAANVGVTSRAGLLRP